MPNKEAMNKGGSELTGYISIDEGDNLLRIVGDIHGVKEHRITVEKKIRMVTCPYEMARWKAEMENSQETEFPQCPLCDQGDKVKKQFLTLAVKRNTSPVEAGILKKGPWVFDPIADYREDTNWGDVTKYDINIKATGKDLDRTYTIVPTPPDKSAPLTPEEENAIEKLKIDTDLEALTTPRSAEDIKKIIAGEPTDIPF